MATYKFEVVGTEQAVATELRLIQAAPDLLAACEAAFDWIDNFYQHAPEPFGGEVKLAAQLAAAIRKAEQGP